MKEFIITSNAETVNSTYNVHQIDLNTMLHNGECQPEDEIIFSVKGDNVACRFKNGGHIIDPGKDAELAESLRKNKSKLEIYQ